MRRRLAIAGCFLSLATGLALFGEQGYLALKARFADELIERAYAAYLLDGESHPPWSWADTHPIGRIGIPRLGLQRTLLAGASGSSLAFGPGHVDGTAAPNAPGNCCVAGFAGLYAKRWTFYIDREGVIREIDKSVSTETAGQDIARKLGELGFPAR